MAIITALYASIIVLIAGILAWRVIKTRQSQGVGIGDGGNDRLIRRMRSQANLLEMALPILLLMLLMELNGMPGWILHLIGIAVTVSRVLHPIGMENRYPNLPLRVGSSVIGMTLLFVCPILLLGHTAISALL